MHRHMVLSLVSACACAGAGTGSSTEGHGKLIVVFNMVGFNITNMDWQAVLFAVRYLSVLFPERMERVVIHASPWVFRNVWHMLQPMIEPLLPKIRFSSSLADLASFLGYPPESVLSPSLGGQAPKFEYPPPAPREAAQTMRADISALVEVERDSLAKQFEGTTLSWATTTGTGTGDLDRKRTIQQVQLRLKSLQGQPFVRAPNLYHRIGLLHEDGSATFPAPSNSGLDPVLVGHAHSIPALISWLASQGADLMTFSYASRLGACGIDRAPDLVPTYVAGNRTLDPSSPSSLSTSEPLSATGKRLPEREPSGNRPVSPRTSQFMAAGRRPSPSEPPSVAIPPTPRRASSTVLSTSSRSSVATSPPPMGALPALPTDRPPARSVGSVGSISLSTSTGSNQRSGSGLLQAQSPTTQGPIPPNLTPTGMVGQQPTRSMSSTDDSLSASGSASAMGTNSSMGIDAAGRTMEDQLGRDDQDDDDDDDDDDISEASDESATHAASVWPDYLPRHKLTKAEVMQTDEEMRADAAKVHKMVLLFLNSQMEEAEAIARPGAGNRMYMAVALALINAVKALMTFERHHLETAQQCSRHAGKIASLLRKKRPKIRLPGRKTSTQTGFLASMTYVQQQAELIYSESHLITSVVGIFLSDETTRLAKHVLNLRKAYLIIRQLDQFCRQQDAAAAMARLLRAQGKKAKDPRQYLVDKDIRCGMQLSYGLCTLVLSLLPSLASKVLGTIGYSSDREQALKALCEAGGWKADSMTPTVGPEEEGLRRALCDLSILVYHLFISAYVPIPDVNLELADKVLQYNLQRFPQGFFFLFFQGRMLTMLALPERAMESYRNAITCQRQYRELSHLVYWDLALSYLTIGDHERAFECFDALSRQSSFSKSLFQYSKGISLYAARVQKLDRVPPDDPVVQRVKTVMGTVPLLCQRVAGQWIGAERFAVGRAKDFVKYGRLTLPGLEFAYIWHVLLHTPVFLLYESAGAMTAREIAYLESVSPAEYNPKDESEWAGAYALAHFLRGTILRFSVYPLNYTLVRLPPDDQMPSHQELVQEAISCFRKVFKVGSMLQGEKVGVLYFAHYELGRMYACMGQMDEATHELRRVVSGKALEQKTKGFWNAERPSFGLEKMVLHRAQLALDLLTDQTKRAALGTDLGLNRYRSPSTQTTHTTSSSNLTTGSSDPSFTAEMGAPQATGLPTSSALSAPTSTSRSTTKANFTD